MEPIIQTHSGKFVNLLHPDPYALGINDIAHALAHICRFGGHVKNYYSVAQHSLIVALNVPAEDALVGLMHDAAEAYCGDMVGPLKHQLPGYQDIEAGLWEALAWRYKLPERLPQSVVDADLRALAAEHRDLHAVRLPWACLNGVNPIAERITPMSPEAGRSCFTKHFYYLRGLRNAKS